MSSQGGVGVADTGLAPTSVSVLMCQKPFDGPPYPRLCHVHPQGFQRREHSARTVDVVHSPAPEPRAVVLLLFPDI